MSINYILCLPLCREVSDSELMQSSSSDAQGGEAIPSLSLVKKKFLGKYAISAEEFSDEMVITEFYALRNVTFRINQETNCCSVGFLLFLPCTFGYSRSVVRLEQSPAT